MKAVQASLEFGLQGAPSNTDSLRQELTRIFVSLREPVFRQVLGMLGNPAEAEDVTQDVFLRLYTEMRARRSVENVRAWAFRTAHNLAVDRYRAGRNTTSLDAEESATTSETLRDRTPQPEESAIANEKLAHYRELLSGLSMQERRCMELRTEGLRYREIAEILGVRITTVQTNLGRAVKKLMEKLNA